MGRILIIEDDPDLQQILEHNLAHAGHEVRVAGRADQGLALVGSFSPHLVLLDLMLPDRPGTEVCKAIKGSVDTRGVLVVMLTAKSEEIDRVVGFELGADDYVVKPFSVRELILRIAAVLRRGAPPEQEEATVHFGLLTVDRAAHRVWVHGREVDLTPLELRLLLTLYESRDHVQSRAALLAKVWDLHADIPSRTVDTHVKRLRTKLGRAREYVETVRGIGYRFVAVPPDEG